jgi:hypothetical protein
VPSMKPDATPTEVASQALDAHSAGDWHRLAALADEESVRAWRDGFVLAHAHMPTLSELAMEDPEVPAEALAQLQEERIARCQIPPGETSVMIGDPVVSKFLHG